MFEPRTFLRRCAPATLALLALSCNAPDSFEPDEGPLGQAAAELTVNAVRPNASVARAGVRGVPDDVNLVTNVDDASPDFDATYIEGTGGSQSSVDFAYPLLTGPDGQPRDGAVTDVNFKYFVRNSLCTAQGLCGKVYSQLLRGNVVVATSAQHDLPAIEQGWFLFNDHYVVAPGAIGSLTQLRTRLVFTHVAPRSTSGMRASTVAADLTIAP